MRKLMLIAGIMLNLLLLLIILFWNSSAAVISGYCFSLLLILYGIFLKNKKARRIISGTLCFLAIALVGFNLFVYEYGQRDNVTYQEDAVIVLGARVNGETPSLILGERLNVALRYYQQNPRVMIVVSGGQGPDEIMTEAQAMKKYLVARGVPAERILQEGKSRNTSENIRFSKLILDQHFDTAYQTVLITNDFHLLRSMIIADRIGLKSAHLHAKIPRHMVPANYLRETISLLFRTLDDSRNDVAAMWQKLF